MTDMPYPRPPYLHRYHTRHGKWIWYVRKGARGRRIHLRAEYGTEAFWDEYRAAIDASTVRKPEAIKAAHMSPPLRMRTPRDLPLQWRLRR